MPRQPVTRSLLGASIRLDMIGKLMAYPIEETLRTQAKARIDNSGDSEIKYEDLWATKVNLGYRSGGIPLRDTSALYNGLRVEKERSGATVTTRLVDTSGYGEKHQEGFVNEGPVAVPLNRTAARVIPEPPNDEDALIAAGLKPLNEQTGDGDFLMLEGDHFVPARPIFNLPPEDLQAIAGSVSDAIGAA